MGRWSPSDLLEDYDHLKALSDIITGTLLMAMLLGIGGLASHAHSAGPVVLSDSQSKVYLVQDLELLSITIDEQSTDRSMVLELKWDSDEMPLNGEIRGTLFVDRVDSPKGCVVACRLDPENLAAAERLTVRISIGEDDSRLGLLDGGYGSLRIRFVQRG